MRIAEVSPLAERVPPRLYGGTERVVSYLTEALVARGHDVTLFASGDSITSARLVPGSPTALRLSPDCVDALPHHLILLERVIEEAAREPFDVIHWHIDFLHYPITRLRGWPSVTTLHGRLDLPDLVPLYREYVEIPVVSISDAQRAPLPDINWIGTVQHGLPLDLYHFEPTPQPYLAFLGRLSPEKRADRAITIARRAGLPLKIAAKVDDADREYFERAIKPLLSEPGVEFIGEVDEAGKQELLGHAAALLFPIDWAEPFGLVMIEAMACGTPVVAWRSGSVPEVITDGVSGFIVDSIDDAVSATHRARMLDRRQCRLAFDAQFSIARMARGYEEMFAALIDERRRPGWTAGASGQPLVELP